jgi:hypothetical protein
MSDAMRTARQWDEWRHQLLYGDPESATPAYRAISTGTPPPASTTKETS